MPFNFCDITDDNGRIYSELILVFKCKNQTAIYKSSGYKSSKDVFCQYRNIL